MSLVQLVPPMACELPRHKTPFRRLGQLLSTQTQGEQRGMCLTVDLQAQYREKKLKEELERKAHGRGEANVPIHKKFGSECKRDCFLLL